MTTNPEETRQTPSIPNELPPLTLFCFNRPDILKGLMNAVLKQSLKPDKILAYVDGPRNESDAEKVSACVEVLKSFSDLPITIKQRNQNFGCRKNILDGVTEVLQEYSSIVVLEDDIWPSEHFYQSMCQLLSSYKDNESVHSVSGYAGLDCSLFARIRPAAAKSIGDQYDSDWIPVDFFQCWGWATWANRWTPRIETYQEGLNPFGSLWKIPRTPLTFFLFDAYYLYFIRKPRDRWTAWDTNIALEMLKEKQVCMVPRRSMVINMGFGMEEAVHSKMDDPGINACYQADYHPARLPESIALAPVMTRNISWPFLLQTLMFRIYRKLGGKFN